MGPGADPHDGAAGRLRGRAGCVGASHLNASALAWQQCALGPCLTQGGGTCAPTSLGFLGGLPSTPPPLPRHRSPSLSRSPSPGAPPPHHRGVAVLYAYDWLGGGEHVVQHALLRGKARLGDDPAAGQAELWVHAEDAAGPSRCRPAQPAAPGASQAWRQAGCQLGASGARQQGTRQSMLDSTSGSRSPAFFSPTAMPRLCAVPAMKRM